ncbi:MAG: EAL domain-containing protein, partial [Bacilli bacterium]|nr:EAL domain-containing protein [Bacilli bacterium]
GIAPSEVVFEVTESDAVKEDPTIEANLKAIQAEGYKIAIDDFGTGYSNISRIMQLDLSVLKFDRSMTDVFAKGDQDDFFRGLFDIFSKRNVKILFEGVETKEVSDKLESMNVDHIQGYYYSKAIPAPEFLKLLEEKNG